MERVSHFALGHRELIEEEGPKERHCLFAALAIPERAHVCFALPQGDGVASVRIVFVSRQPLVLQALHITPQCCRLLIRSLETIPLAGNDPSPKALFRTDVAVYATAAMR